MKPLTRWIAYAGDQQIGWAFSEAGARKIAYEYEEHCMNQEDPFLPAIWIWEETADDDVK